MKTSLAQGFLLRNVILIHRSRKKYTLRQSISAFLSVKTQTWAYSLALPLALRYHFDKVLNNFISSSKTTSLSNRDFELWRRSATAMHCWVQINSCSHSQNIWWKQLDRIVPQMYVSLSGSDLPDCTWINGWDFSVKSYMKSSSLNRFAFQVVSVT